MADVVIGTSLIADDQVSPKVKNIKAELKLAQQEVQMLSDKFGATSKQAAEAAKKAAELKDRIGDAKSLVDAFNPDTKFRAFGASINTVVGGFTALTGAMALLNVESEDVQRTLVKVQSALAISQGVAQVQEGIQSFKNLGSVIVNTLGKSGAIGLAIAGVTALGLALSGVFNRKQNDAAKAYNDTLRDYHKAATQARQTITEVKIAFEQARAGVISKNQALKIYNDTLGDSLGTTNDINEAERLTVQKADAYIKVTALKAQANALFARAADQTADALIAQDKLSKEGKLNVFGTDVIQLLNADIEKSKQGALSIQKLAEDLLRQAGTLSQTSGINIGGSKTTANTGKNSPAVTAQKEETAEIILDWSTRKDNVLLRQQELADSLKASQKDLVEFGKQAAKEEADEKIAQKDRERENARINAEGNILIAQQEAAARIAAAQSIGNALGSLSDLIGRETAAGKVLGIAQATINTFIGATEVLRAKSVLPEPFGTIAKIANVTAVIATGLSAVKNIVKTKVPGSSGGGASISAGASVSSPLQPTAPQATSTLLNQQQLNQIGNATVRAFVIESDVTNNQDRIRRLNRAARL